MPTFDPTKTDPKDLAEQSLDFSAEVQSLPGDGFQFASGQRLTSNVPKFIPQCAYGLTLIDVPDLPGGDATIYFAMMGKINETAFFGAAPKTAFFIGTQTDRTFTTAGFKGWKIQNKFLVRPKGLEWTKQYNPDTGLFEEVTSVGSGKSLYETDDLTKVLPK